MKKKQIRNVAASVRERLANRAKADGLQFQEVLRNYGMERFLYRLSVSPHRDKFILKGGLMLRVWGGPAARPTMDIDMLGRTSNDQEKLLELLKEVCQTPVDDDGMVLDITSATANVIQKEGDYKGVRLVVPWSLANAKMLLQLDLGFGDSVYPEPEELNIPSLLDQPSALLKCYPRETLIAEKFEAMIHLGERNSRVKDFYDLWLLSGNSEFDRQKLLEALSQTLRTRGTRIDDRLVFLTDEFAAAKAGEWKAFRRKMQRESIPADFSQIVAELRPFLKPLAEELRPRQRAGWQGGGWQGGGWKGGGWL